MGEFLNKNELYQKISELQAEEIQAGKFYSHKLKKYLMVYKIAPDLYTIETKRNQSFSGLNLPSNLKGIILAGAIIGGLYWLFSSSEQEIKKRYNIDGIDGLNSIGLFN